MNDLLIWMKEDVEQTGCSLNEEGARQWDRVYKRVFQRGLVQQEPLSKKEERARFSVWRKIH